MRGGGRARQNASRRLDCRPMMEKKKKKKKKKKNLFFHLELWRQLLRQPLDGRQVTYIHAHRVHRHAVVLLQSRLERFQPPLPPRHQHQLAALGGKAPGAGLANAGAGACNK